MNKQYIPLLCCAALLLSSSCTSDNPQDNPEPVICPVAYSYAEGDTWGPSEKTPVARAGYEEIILTSDERDAIKSQNDFALDLFSKISSSESANTLLSPISLSLDLSMLANGADGATLETLRKAV